MTANTSSSRKQKGMAFQKEVTAKLVSELCINPRDVKSTPSGVPGCDIYLSQAARDLFPFGIECKRQEALNIWQAIEQCTTNAAAEGLKPLLVFRRNRSEPFVVLRLGDFLELQKAASDPARR